MAGAISKFNKGINGNLCITSCCRSYTNNRLWLCYTINENLCTESSCVSSRAVKDSMKAVNSRFIEIKDSRIGKNCRTLSYPANSNRYVLESESDISRDILRTENPLAINIIKTFLCVGVSLALFITTLNLGLEAIDFKYLLVSHKSALKSSHLH